VQLDEILARYHLTSAPLNPQIFDMLRQVVIELPEARSWGVATLRDPLRRWMDDQPRTHHKWGEVYAEALYVWSKLDPEKCGPGITIEQACVLAQSTRPVDADDEDYTEAQKRLLSVCYVLACKSKNGVFFISSEQAREILGRKSRYSGWVTLNLFIHKGAFVVHKPGKKGPGQKATRYRWTGRGALREIPAHTPEDGFEPSGVAGEDSAYDDESAPF